MEYYAIFNTTTGVLQWKSCGPLGTGAEHSLPDGMALVVMPYEAFVALPDDLAPLKAAVVDQINVGAGNFRKQFITDIPGQQDTYLAKEAEAKAWSTGADPAGFPYLSAEAAATASTVGDTANLILATSAQWRALDPKIEGRRRGAGVAVAGATNIAAIVAAGQVDWAALLSPVQPTTAA